MGKESLRKFLNWFIDEDNLKVGIADFVGKSEEERMRQLTELAVKFAIDPETIDIPGLAQTPESENFRLFIRKAYGRVRDQLPDIPNPKNGL